jgi:microcystin-dependent protein
VSNPFLGSIILFAGNFAPRGWAFCNGQVLAIAQNQALFSLLGTTYGGNGQTTFALPDLRGRVPIHPGQGPGLSPVDLGEISGVEVVTLTTSQLPPHTHPQPATNGEQTTNRPNNALPARGGVYSNESDGSLLHPTLTVGGGQPHENRQPFLGLNYIIALEGIYPSRN